MNKDNTKKIDRKKIRSKIKRRKLLLMLILHTKSLPEKVVENRINQYYPVRIRFEPVLTRY